jgi:hypothetical protein
VKNTAKILQRAVIKTAETWADYEQSNPDWTDEEKRRYFLAYLGKLQGDDKLPKGVKTKRWARWLLGGVPYVPGSEGKRLYPNRLTFEKSAVMGAMPVSLQPNADVNGVIANQPRASVSKAASPAPTKGNVGTLPQQRGPGSSTLTESLRKLNAAPGVGTLPAPKPTVSPGVSSVKQTSMTKNVGNTGAPQIGGNGPTAPSSAQQNLNDLSSVTPSGSGASNDSMPLIKTESAKLAWFLNRKTALSTGVGGGTDPVYRNDQPASKNPAAPPLQEKSETGLMAASNKTSALTKKLAASLDLLTRLAPLVNKRFLPFDGGPKVTPTYLAQALAEGGADYVGAAVETTGKAAKSLAAPPWPVPMKLRILQAARKLQRTGEGIRQSWPLGSSLR